ncbi:hypothetical protein [Janthinobacterium sp. 17J80-10]|uniref:hypothetical protein n=1 Tax=Janthinobacterium sp. 17J80-10 TaxID=2497863 RepID=UPI0010056DDF|nr:hypothetical protein [Janthinobacterium sp. 17J80-10]QAU34673.1 hypothetical protein EKL02_11025 [Janthinobacterium sp. 17J80-10]
MHPKKNSIKISAVFFGLVFTWLTITVVTSREALASVLIRFSDFREIAPGIYLEPGGPPGDKDDFLSSYKEARSRISNAYGEYSAQPIIIGGHSDKMLRYGNGFGSSHFQPWGAYVVVGPQGRNVDVIAHELVHAELFHRIGYWKRMTQIPAWFEEGVAMQVDYRKPFDFENFKGNAPTNKEKLWWQAQFNSGGGDAVTFNYAWSKEVVRSWRLGHSQSQFYELLKEISEGKSFEEAFAASGNKS